jgi:anti-sigma B factor antagonist
MDDDDQIAITVVKGVTVVRLGTDFASIYESDLARLDGLRELADTATPARVVIDLSHTRYFGSAFIGILMATAARLKDRGNGQLGLSGLQPFATMALESTKADTLLGLFESVDDAVATLRPND